GLADACLGPEIGDGDEAAVAARLNDAEEGAAVVEAAADAVIIGNDRVYGPLASERGDEGVESVEAADDGGGTYVVAGHARPDDAAGVYARLPNRAAAAPRDAVADVHRVDRIRHHDRAVICAGDGPDGVPDGDVAHRLTGADAHDGATGGDAVLLLVEGEGAG